MAKLTELVPQDHHNLCFSKTAQLEFFSKQHVLPLNASEIARAATAFPVFLNRQIKTGTWSLTAVTSLEAARNLFIENAQWQGLYEPVFMRTYPFFLMNSSDPEKSYVVGFDDQCDALKKDQGEALYADQKPDEHLAHVTKLLESNIQADQQTQLFAKTLDELRLSNAVNLQVMYDDSNHQTITSLFTINEDALQALSPEQITDLNKRGYLLPIHAMLLSIYQLNNLVRRHNKIAQGSSINQVKIELARDHTT